MILSLVMNLYFQRSIDIWKKRLPLTEHFEASEYAKYLDKEQLMELS